MEKMKNLKICARMKCKTLKFTITSNRIQLILVLMLFYRAWNQLFLN